MGFGRSLIGYTALAQWLFVRHRLMLDAAGPLATTLVSGYLEVVVFGFFAEEKEKAARAICLLQPARSRASCSMRS